MALMQSTNLSEQDKHTLKNIARQSIQHGLLYNQPLAVNPEEFAEILQADAASFVTLNLDHQLRGCIGTLQAYQPLVTDVAQHAYDAAFKDPRFAPVSESEAPLLDIHISILTQAEPMSFTDEADLLKQLKPGVDGLILEDDYHKGTFLPSVWEQLPEPENFLKNLKRKAGLSEHHWSPELKISRYQSLSF